MSLRNKCQGNKVEKSLAYVGCLCRYWASQANGNCFEGCTPDLGNEKLCEVYCHGSTTCKPFPKACKFP